MLLLLLFGYLLLSGAGERELNIVIHADVSASGDSIKPDGTSSTITMQVKDQVDSRIEYNRFAKGRVTFRTSKGYLEGANPVEGTPAGITGQEEPSL